MVWWHASSAERGFDWFGHGEQFLVSIDPSFKLDVYLVMGLTALVYVVRQGMLETSNVDAVGEMVNLMEHVRLFESQQKALKTTDDVLGAVTRDLGSF